MYSRMSALSSATRMRSRVVPGDAGAASAGATSPARAAIAALPHEHRRTGASGVAARRHDRSGGRCALPSGMLTSKSAALPGAALGADLAAVHAHQLLHEREPDARPSCVRARAPSMRWKRSKSCGISAGRCRRRCPHREHRCPSRSCSVSVDLAGECELECVRHEVQDDLLPHVPIDERRRAQGLALHPKSRPAFSQADAKLLASSAVKSASSVAS